VIAPETLERTLDAVEKAIHVHPYVSGLRDPFRVLVSTVVSARTKDETTKEVSERLLSRVRNANDLAGIPLSELERLLYPAGFYRTKARSLKRLAEVLLQQYGGGVPDTLGELVSLPGVGRKTANLVLIVAFGKPGVCVDTHVHRICNRWGLVRTKKPNETEVALRAAVPRRLWHRINALLVPFGREVCRPTSPFCSSCPLEEQCPKVGVKKHR